MERLEEILSLIGEEELRGLGLLYGVNNYNTKLKGELIFKGLMKLILSGKKTSLRMLETLINQGFGIFEEEDKVKVSYSGISKRLKVINWKYFEGIFKNLVERSVLSLSKGDRLKLHRFDSTIINLSGYLIKDGLKVGGKAHDSQIKVSIGLKDRLPSSIRFCSSQEESSEDIALIKAINEAKIDKEDILLFDRGISKAASFADFEEREYKFITRVNVTRKHKILASNPIDKTAPDNAGIREDLIVNLYGTKAKHPIACNLRLIKLLNKNENEIWFLTNLFEMPPCEVASLYKKRWDIEIFFKFIKQNLGYKHFLSHSMNGMKVYIYMILITALIFLIYKIKNNLKGFKIALLQFTINLEKSFLKTIIILAGGDFNAVKHLF